MNDGGGEHIDRAAAQAALTTRALPVHDDYTFEYALDFCFRHEHGWPPIIPVRDRPRPRRWRERD